MRGGSGISTDVAAGVHRVEDAYVNWYLVEEDGEVAIFDTGLPRSWGSMERALHEIGRTPAAVVAVVLTHGHFDHMGFARRAQEELAVPVFAAEPERSVVSHPWHFDHERSRVPYLLRYPGLRRVLVAMTMAGALRVRGTDEIRPLAMGEPLDVPGRPVPIATPGHTYGHVSFHLPDRGVLIAGDAVVTFNPYTGTTGPQIVAGAATADSAHALASLDEIAALDAPLVLPGHGAPWTGGTAELVAQAREAGPS